MVSFNLITQDDFTRVNSDVNGNPRYAIHYTVFFRPENIDIFDAYNWVLNKSKQVLKGSRKFHNKQFGGGIVIQSYNIQYEIDAINCYNIGFVTQELINCTNNNVVDCRRINEEMFVIVVTDKNNALNDCNVNLFVHVQSNDHIAEIKKQLQTKGLIL